MSWIELALAVLTLINKVWDAIKEKNDASKKQQTEAVQSAVRGIIDHDASRINDSFDKLRRLRIQDRQSKAPAH